MKQNRRSATPASQLPDPPQPAGSAWSRLSLPVKIGLAFGTLGLLLTLIGIFRGQVPMAPANILVALLLGGGVWFVIAWAVATAAVDVERDLE